jgi:hypothetical protein
MVPPRKGSAVRLLRFILAVILWVAAIAVAGLAVYQCGPAVNQLVITWAEEEADEEADEEEAVTPASQVAELVSASADSVSLLILAALLMGNATLLAVWNAVSRL